MAIDDMPVPDTGFEAVDQNPHFVAAVTRAGEQHEIIAQQDIYAANGMLLLAKGARIDKSTHVRLIAHRLELPLDLVLRASDSLDEGRLARDMDKFVAEDPILSNIVARAGTGRGYKSVLGNMKIPMPLLFRLTVMRNDRSELYRHSVRTAVIAHCIGMRLELSDEKLAHLCLASISHDIGEMHTDPAVLEKGKIVDSSERRFIHVHPVTGYVILSKMEGVPAEVMQAVLQHHERLDGSGYPYAVTQEKISATARVIAIAETMEAIARRSTERQIRIAVRFNRGRLDPEYVSAADNLLRISSAPVTQAGGDGDLNRKLKRLLHVLDAWPELHHQIKTEQQLLPLGFLAKRMQNIQFLALQAGLSSDLLDCLDLAGDDSAVVPELNAALTELDHVISDLVFEVERRALNYPACMPMAGRIRESFHAS